MIAILNACGANLASVQFAIERLGKQSVLTIDPKILQSATHVILPGVGTAKHAMDKIQALALADVIRQLTQPVLGICLGMQILYEHSSEGDAVCLGLIPGNVTALPEKKEFTFPHMGWNQLNFISHESALLDGIDDHTYMYYVHGYAAPVSEYTLASTDYSNTFSAVVQYQNFYGMQFHPERSGKIGQKLLENFFGL
jgi:glutamine amidotransferase